MNIYTYRRTTSSGRHLLYQLRLDSALVIFFFFIECVFTLALALFRLSLEKTLSLIVGDVDGPLIHPDQRKDGDALKALSPSHHLQRSLDPSLFTVTFIIHIFHMRFVSAALSTGRLRVAVGILDRERHAAGAPRVRDGAVIRRVRHAILVDNVKNKLRIHVLK